MSTFGQRNCRMIKLEIVDLKRGSKKSGRIFSDSAFQVAGSHLSRKNAER